MRSGEGDSLARLGVAIGVAHSIAVGMTVGVAVLSVDPGITRLCFFRSRVLRSAVGFRQLTLNPRP